MTSPGTPGSRLPAGEDEIMRRLRDLERQITEMRGADILAPAGMVVGPNSVTIVGDLTIPAGVIGTPELAPVVITSIETAQTTADDAADEAAAATSAAAAAQGAADDASTTATAAQGGAATATSDAAAASSAAAAATDAAAAAEGQAATATSAAEAAQSAAAAAQGEASAATNAASAAQTQADTATTDAATAQSAAVAASGLAGTKAVVLFQPAEPAGDPLTLWIDTTGGANTPKKWSGTEWVAITDKAATDAAAAAAAAASTAGAAVTNAATAQSAAVAAQGTAGTAVTNAAAAQTQANTATTNAATAQTAATAAGTAASNAQGTANTAITNAAAAQAAAVAAQGTANTAVTSANGKTRVVWSIYPASGTAYGNGDVWFQKVGASIVGQWEFISGAWAARTLASAVIASLDAAKIVVGELSGFTLTGGLIRTAATGKRIELNSATRNLIKFYSGGAKETAFGSLVVDVDVDGIPFVTLQGPTVTGYVSPTFSVKAANAADDSPASEAVLLSACGSLGPFGWGPGWGDANDAARVRDSLRIDGGLVVDGRITSLESEWTAYTPTLTRFAVGTLPSGVPKAIAEWRREGDLIRVRYCFVFGSNGVAPTAPLFSLPVPSAPLPHAYMLAGVGGLLDVSVPKVFPSWPLLQNTTTVIIGYGIPSADIAPSVPFVWAQGDAMSGDFTYRPAS